MWRSNDKDLGTYEFSHCVCGLDVVFSPPLLTLRFERFMEPIEWLRFRTFFGDRDERTKGFRGEREVSIDCGLFSSQYISIMDRSHKDDDDHSCRKGSGYCLSRTLSSMMMMMMMERSQNNNVTYSYYI
jgi:hypothetical protein